MKKRLFLLLLTLLPMVASADDSGSCGENVTYTYVESTHTLTISGSGAMTNYSYSNNTVNSPWYSYRSEIVKAVVEDGVTSIGNYAFFYCSGLTSVNIPNSVTSIGDDAFRECSGLTAVHITDLAAWCGISFASDMANPLLYAHHLILNETEIKDLVIPSRVTSIDVVAFLGCSGLTSVTIPNSVTSIGFMAFYGCSGLTSVTIPNSVTSIGEGAFQGCI